jgi:hypothetical protein
MKKIILAAISRLGSFRWKGAVFFLWAACATAAAEIELELERAFPVEGPKSAEPSGLARYGGKWYTVSDENSDTIFELVWEKNCVRMVPAVRFRPPGFFPTDALDPEGISVDSEGNFYLASEQYRRILRVPRDGKTSRWVTPDLGPAGRAAGLFRRDNAGLEGVAWAGNGRWFACVEREPRGIFEVEISAGVEKILPFRVQTNRQLPSKRPADFADLYEESGKLFALFRNGDAVVRLERTAEGYEEKETWSYRETAERPEYRYRDARFGVMEGLCMDENFVYLIADNNHDERQTNKKDRRPLLLIFKRPAASQP